MEFSFFSSVFVSGMKHSFAMSAHPSSRVVLKRVATLQLRLGLDSSMKTCTNCLEGSCRENESQFLYPIETLSVALRF
jgi:hypothetical protein